MQIKENDIVFDIGGNIGAFAKWASPKCREVVSYEPCPDNFEVHKKNVQECSNVVSYNKAIISTNESRVSFYLNTGKNKGMHSSVKKRGHKEITVDAANFYSELMIHSPNKIKIDIEGGEYDLLLNKDLPPFVDTLAIEFHLNRKEWRQDKAIKLMAQLKQQFKRTIVVPKITEANWATVGIYKMY